MRIVIDNSTYGVIPEDRSLFWEVTISIIVTEIELFESGIWMR
jgi:hypothetical protein